MTAGAVPIGGAVGERLDPGHLTVSGARPYRWPYDGGARPGATALVIVAGQAAVAATCVGASATLDLVSTLATAVRSWGGSVVATRHARSPALRRPATLPSAGGRGWDLDARLGDATVVDAHGVDAFSASALTATLTGRGISHLLLCGLGIEGPVHSTLRSANDQGFECLLVADACAAADPTLCGAALLSIEMSGGIFGAVATSGELLDALASARNAAPRPDRRYAHARPH